MKAEGLKVVHSSKSCLGHCRVGNKMTQLHQTMEADLERHMFAFRDDEG
jgi:hypothetical protein